MPEAIDRRLRELAQELVVREVAYGQALDAFFSADGWRRLGYATAAQYGRERLGTSLSSIKSKRQLAKRLSQLRFLADALERGELGYEAARLVASVATRETEEAWVARAKERTLRHLREEIAVAELLARWSETTAVVPPSDADVQRVEEMERAIVVGQICAPPVPPQAATAAGAKVTLRLRMRASTARDFRHWEAIYLRHRGAALRGTTFLRFACEVFTETWRPPLPPRRHSSRPDLCGPSSIEHSLDLRAERTHGRRRAAADQEIGGSGAHASSSCSSRRGDRRLRGPTHQLVFEPSSETRGAQKLQAVRRHGATSCSTGNQRPTFSSMVPVMSRGTGTSFRLSCGEMGTRP